MSAFNDDNVDFDDIFDNPVGAVIANNRANGVDSTYIASHVERDDLFDYVEIPHSERDDEGIEEEQPQRMRFNPSSSRTATMNVTSEDISSYVPARYHTVDFSHVIEEPTPNPQWCCFCECDQTFREKEQNNRYDAMYEYVDKNFNRVKEGVLTSHVQQMYNTGIRRHTPLKLPWYQQTIWEHVTEHAPTTRVMLEMTLRHYNNQLHVLTKNEIYLVNQQDTRQYKIDPEKAKLAAFLTDKRNAVLKQVAQQRQAVIR